MFRRVRQVAAPGAKLLSTIAGLFPVASADRQECQLASG